MAATASAGDKPDARSIEISEIAQVEAISDDQRGKAFALLGRVEVEIEGAFRVRARRMVVWLDPRADRQIFKLFRGLKAKRRLIPIWAVRALYAEGGRAPALFHAAGRVFRCSSLYYDFTSHKGLLVDAELRIRRTDPEVGVLPDLVVRAKRFRATGPGRWRAQEVRLFSTDYFDPQVAVQIDRIEIRDPKMGEALGELMRLSAEGGAKGVGIPEELLERVLEQLEAASLDQHSTKIDFESITARVFDFPIFKWPRIRADQEGMLRLRVELDAGSRGRLGSGGRLGLGIRNQPVGFLVGAGYYDGRGPLLDLELNVDAFDGAVEGRSYGVYLRDHGTDSGVEPSTRNRFWTKNQHRWTISEVWRLDGEYADLSDAGFLFTIDEREFKEEKEQESLLYLRGRSQTGFVTLTGKLRTIRFARVLEESPRLAAALPVLTLLRFGRGGAVQIAVEAEAANLRLRRGVGDPLPDVRTGRFDLDPVVFVPFSLGPVRVVPFAAFRFTAYGDSVSRNSLGRFAGTAGVRGDIQFSRWFGETRHAVNVSVEWADLYALSESASMLFALDTVEMLTPYEQVTLRVRNRLQRRTDDGLDTYLTFEVFFAYFPDRQQPLGRMGDAILELNLAYWEREQRGLSLRASIDPEGGRLDTGAVEGWVQARGNLLLGAGFRHLEGDSDIFTLTADLEVDTRWRILLFAQYDFTNDDYLDQGVFIQRLGQTAVFGIRLAFDPGDDDFSVSVKLDLVQAFRKKRARRRADYRPEFYRQ